MRAVRKVPWKAHFITQASYTKNKPEVQNPPLLYNLETDPSEKYNVGAQYPEIVKDLQDLYHEQVKNVIPAESEINKVLVSDQK